MTKYQLDQRRAPLHEALLAYRKKRMVPFDVPGHKQGRGNLDLRDFLGKDCLSVDVNSMKMLDNLIHPVSVIKEAEELTAAAFFAHAAFFMVNGTSSAVQAMIMASVNPGEKIIMPRNVHRSAINALILAKAVPVYLDPGIDLELGIPLAMSLETVKAAIAKHPDAKAIFVNHPTYYGVCSNLREIAKLAHKAGMRVLADEAHGTHFYFSSDLGGGAMTLGADMAAVSTHKTGGSLTQSSVLLLAKSMAQETGYVRQIINLAQTTSASYLLMASIDLARRDLALNGASSIAKVLDYANYARGEINKIDGLYAFSKEKCNQDSWYSFDESKLSIHTRSIGLAGVEVYEILRDEYNIQIEFGDLGNILAIVSVGDRAVAIERLIAALSEIKRIYGQRPDGLLASEYIEPHLVLAPHEAFYAPSIQLPLEQCLGRVCTEFVMCYPPGIPIIAPGELVTESILEYIHYAKEKGASMTGTEDLALNLLNVKEE